MRLARRFRPWMSAWTVGLVLGVATALGAPVERHLVLTNLATAPFPHRSRANGHTYKETFYPAALHYQDNRVAIALPRGFQPGPAVDVVVHFHGWYNNVTNALAQFRLLEQLEASGRQAVLVLPEGPRDAPDSGGGNLEEAGGFARLMEDVLRVLRSELGRDVRLGRVTLSGHSGGYRVIGWILHHGGLAEAVREVFLFDAIYAQTEQFAAWAKQDRHRFVAIYTDGGGTVQETRRLIKDLKGDGLPVLELEDTPGMDRPWAGGRTVFLHTDLGHNEVIAARRHFERFLR